VTCEIGIDEDALGVFMLVGLSATSQISSKSY